LLLGSSWLQIDAVLGLLFEGPLGGVERTSLIRSPMFPNDPKRPS
jgi:hypothetical protein